MKRKLKENNDQNYILEEVTPGRRYRRATEKKIGEPEVRVVKFVKEKDIFEEYFFQKEKSRSNSRRSNSQRKKINQKKKKRSSDHKRFKDINAELEFFKMKQKAGFINFGRGKGQKKEKRGYEKAVENLKYAMKLSHNSLEKNLRDRQNRNLFDADLSEIQKKSEDNIDFLVSDTKTLKDLVMKTLERNKGNRR